MQEILKQCKNLSQIEKSMLILEISKDLSSDLKAVVVAGIGEKNYRCFAKFLKHTCERVEILMSEEMKENLSRYKCSERFWFVIPYKESDLDLWIRSCVELAKLCPDLQVECICTILGSIEIHTQAKTIMPGLKCEYAWNRSLMIKLRDLSKYLKEE